MRRRDFVALVGGAATAPTILGTRAACAQQNGRMRRVGMLMGGAGNDPVWQGYTATFRQALAKLGWIEGRNLRIDLQFGEGDANRLRAHAAELVKLTPEVIFTSTQAAARAVQQQTRTIPIVVAGSGTEEISATALVKNITRPEGNITAFPILYSSIGGKWLELLKDAAPRIVRVAIIFNPDTAASGNIYPNNSYVPSIEAAAQVLGVKAIDMPFRNAAELERAIDAFAVEPNGGLIVLPGAGTATRDTHQSILLLAAKHRLPAIMWDKTYPAEGGLMSYGSDYADLHRRAATYVDRLLRGAKVNELPVQYPTKFDLVINLKAAKAIGLTIPEAFLLRADEVIE